MAKTILSLSSLSHKWLAAKAAEEEARLHRIALEEEIEALVPGPEEGSASTSVDNLKITVTRKFNRSIDYEAYKEYADLIPSEITPIKTKLEVDMKLYRAVQVSNPDAFKIVQKFVEVRPAKTAIKIEGVSK